MTGTILERMTEVPDNLRELDEDLAAKAAKYLDYTLAQATVQRDNMTTRLQTQLLQLGIPGFKPESVERYKDSVSRAKWIQMWAWMTPSIVLAYATFYMAGHTALVFQPAMTGVAAFVLFFTPIFSVQPANWRWQSHELAHYPKPIPAHVLQTALMINDKIINARLSVEEFVLMETLRVADPFLVVRVGDAIVHVEVWDEPSFKP